MSTVAEWAYAYARQADADYKAWQAMDEEPFEECHRLMLLQMCCEKLCKAYLISAGTAVSSLQTSHGYIAKPLPVAIRELIVRSRPQVNLESQMRYIRHLAQEIEILNPAMKRNGQRPDNCEYPWEDHTGLLHSPLDCPFTPTRLLFAPAGRLFVKMLRRAIDTLLD